MMNSSHLESERLARAKAAFTTRHVDFSAINTLLSGNVTPQVGDLVLAQVAGIGQHNRIELADGRKAILFPGDEVVVCYGNRYAPDQFEAEVPDDLSQCHLAAAGGVAAKVLSQHSKMKSATALKPIGLLGDRNGKPVNIAQWALEPTPYIGHRPLTLVVAGACMNAGKTTTAAHLIRGLVMAGLKVGAAKVTGTGAGGDLWLMRDAGASPVLDFTHVGFPSTYKASPQDVLKIWNTLTSHLAAEGVEVMVLELADGLYQEETSKLIASLDFRNSIDGILFAAGSALGATAGVEWLKRFDIRVLGISGLLAASPLAMREAEIATKLPVFELEQLWQPNILDALGCEPEPVPVIQPKSTLNSVPTKTVMSLSS